MIFASFLLLIATDLTAVPIPPVKLVCRRDSAGNCLPVERSLPVKLLREDEGQATEIYRICFWNNLKVQEEFGRSDPQRALEVQTSAMEACATQKDTADRNMDAYLRPLAFYGDDARKHFVRDYFRSSAGDAFIEQAASSEGRHDDLARTLEAYQQLMLGQIQNARGK
jgi:hypothetical protein